jgi:hypothetical protein
MHCLKSENGGKMAGRRKKRGKRSRVRKKKGFDFKSNNSIALVMLLVIVFLVMLGVSDSPLDDSESQAQGVIEVNIVKQPVKSTGEITLVIERPNSK